MRLSIITVVYNDCEGLTRTLASLALQENKNFEHIVIDGGSDDGTLEVIKDNLKKIDFFISEPDKGIYDAMNKGIKHSSADFVSFLNAGDIAQPNYVATCIRFFEENDQLDYCYSNVLISSRKTKKIYFTKSDILENDILQRMPFPHPGLFVRRGIFKIVGNFNTEMKITSDHEWIVRMIKSGVKGGKVNSCEPVVDFKLDGVSLSFATVFEMRNTAIKNGRKSVLANLKVLYGILVVMYYKYFK